MLAILAKLSFLPYLQNSPVSPTFMGPLIALCFAMLAILAKLSFSPYLPNLPVSPTFMGPPHCFVLCHVGDSGKIVIFAIFAKFASIANFYRPLIAFCFALLAIEAILLFSPYLLNSPVSPTFMGPLIALCFALLAIVAKLSFLPYLPNSPLCSLFCHFCCCVHFWTYLASTTPMNENHARASTVREEIMFRLLARIWPP